jgi:hypothetical protein
MIPADDSEIGLRRRPSAALLLWGWRLLAAWLVAAPLARAVAAAGAGHLADGDAALFEPGGQLLVETLRVGGATLGAALQSAVGLLLVVGALGLLPLAAVLVSLAHRGRLRFGDWAGRAAAHLPAFVLLSLLTLLSQALALVAWGLVAGGASAALESVVDERSRDVALVAALLPGLALVLGLGLAEDLGRARVVRHGASGWSSWLAALGLLLRRPGPALLGWLTPAAWAVAAVVAAEIAVRAIDVSRAGAARPWAAFAVHQAAALALAAARVAWLGRALQLVGVPSEDARSPGDRAEGTDAPDGPSPAPAA